MVDPVAVLQMLNIPLTIGGAIALLIQVVIISAVIMILDYVVAHEVEVKYAFLIGLGAYFITPLVVVGLSLANYFDPLVAAYVIPLAVWLGLSEAFLQTTAKNKAIVAIAAFTVYVLLNYFGVPFIIVSLIPF